MQSYNRTETSKRISGYTHVGMTTVNANAWTKQFTVVDQVLSGNFISPNKNHYRILESRSGGYSRLRREATGGRFVYFKENGPYWLAPLAQFPFTPDWNGLEDKCMGQIYSKMKSGANLAVDLAEGRSTSKLVKSVLLAGRTIRQIVRDAKRAPWEVPASLWMAYRYGVMPLIYSAGDIVEAIHRREDRRRFWVRGRAGNDISEVVISDTGNGTVTSPKLRTVCRIAQAKMEIKVGFQLRVSDVYNWTSLNPLAIAWELLPLSVVADWFLNVGEFLQACENRVLFGNSFIGGYKTKTLFYDYIRTTQSNRNDPVNYNPTNGQPLNGIYNDNIYGVNYGRYVDKDRLILAELPWPHGIRVRVEMNAKRYTDAASLAVLFASSRNRR